MMAKPAGGRCNLACRYCYYLDNPAGRAGSGIALMDDSTLERFIRDYIASSPCEDVMFIWHGGEPLLRDEKFFNRVISLQKKHSGGHHIDNSLQTNGTLITPGRARFLADNGFLVGVSIDGPSHIHDFYRRDRSGKGTHSRVLRGIELLERFGVEWNAMAVINNLNVGIPAEFYRYFRDTLGCRYLQFTPVFGTAPESVTPEAWGAFLCGVFDEWIAGDVGMMFVQIFEAVLANLAGMTPGVCTLAPQCGSGPVIEHNGDVYTCDHFVNPRNLLGNIRRTPLSVMLNDGRLSAFGADKQRLLPAVCKECEYLRVCNGECPANRPSPDRPCLLCAGYRRFFSHALPSMQLILDDILASRPLSRDYSRR